MFSVLDDPVCDIDPHNQGVGPPVSPLVLHDWPGLRVGIAQHGLVPSDENSRASLVIGQPEADDGRGRLGVTPLVRANSAAGAPFILQPPGLAVNDHFGASVAIADIRNCTPEGAGARACGREILAGAPQHADPAHGRGAVFWFQAQSVSGNLPELELGGVVYAPSSVMDGFGRAIAVPRLVHDADAPWNPAPAAVPWVAVGARQPHAVHIYKVFPGSSSPLVPLMIVPAPASSQAGSFGEFMTIGDFDGDGFDDLAVAWTLASDTSLRFISVFWGQAGLIPLSLSSPTVVEMDDVPFAEPFSTPSMSPHAADFATSIAAGPMLLDDPRELLVAGAPGVVSHAGAACWYVFGATTRAVVGGQCRFNPLGLAGSTAGDRFGASVAIDNVYPVDEGLAFGTAQADLHELVVSAPGREDTGVVVAFPSTGTAPDFQTLRAELRPPPHESGYGTQVATGYVQRTAWSDIVAHCADCGGSRRAEVSRAMLPDDGTSCPNPSGVWLVDDDNGVGRQVTIALSTDGTTRIVFDEPFVVSLREDGGSGPVCTVGPDDDIVVAATIPAGSVLSIPSVGVCDAGTRHYDDVPPGPVIVPVLGALGVWSVLPGIVQGFILTQDIELTMDVVEPVGSVPASVVLGFDISSMPRSFPGFPNYNLANDDCNVAIYSGSNLDDTFSVGVCE